MNDEWSHHWTQKPNLEYIKKNGKEKWLLVQRKEWTCKSCGAGIKWYQKKMQLRPKFEGMGWSIS